MIESAAADLARAEEQTEQALVASPRNALPHYAKGQVLRAQRRYEEAISEYETVLAFNKNWALAYIHIAMCKIFTGSIEEAIPLVEQAMRLTPHDPEMPLFYNRSGSCICSNRARPRRSSGSKSGAAPIRYIQASTPTWPPPTLSKGRPNVLPPNSPKPGD